MALYSPYRGRRACRCACSCGPRATRTRSCRAVTRIIRDLSANQAVERPATLEDVRAEVLTPERLNAFVVSGFAGIALLIAVVGVSGVLAFSVSARTREFGVRLAVGLDAAQPADAACCRRARPSSPSASPPAPLGGYAVHRRRRRATSRNVAGSRRAAARCRRRRARRRRRGSPRCCRRHGQRGSTCCRPCAPSRSSDSVDHQVVRFIDPIARSIDRSSGRQIARSIARNSPDKITRFTLGPCGLETLRPRLRRAAPLSASSAATAAGSTAIGERLACDVVAQPAVALELILAVELVAGRLVRERRVRSTCTAAPTCPRGRSSTPSGRSACPSTPSP